MVSTIFGDGNKATSKTKEEMRIDTDYKFIACVSKEAYTDKQRAKAATLGDEKGRKLRSELKMKNKAVFIPIETTAQGLLSMALQGYLFCGLFANDTLRNNTRYYTKDGYFTLSTKEMDNFKGAYYVGVDIDNTRYSSPTEFISKLKFKPTFWYSTFSHLTVDKNNDGILDNKFRLVYTFDSPIQDPYFFRYCSYTIHKQIENDTQEGIEDDCGTNCTQNFIGTSVNELTEYGISDIIYSLSDFQITEDGYLEFLQQGCGYGKNIKAKHKRNIQQRICVLLSHNTSLYKHPTPTPPQYSDMWDKKTQSDDWKCSILGFDIGMQLDYQCLTYDKFHNFYKHRYKYCFRKEKEEWLMIDNIRYQKCDDDYLELPYIVLTTDSDGNSIKIMDGQNRKGKLFFRAWMRRIINPRITPSELLYNLMVDKERFFDDSDGALTLECMKNMVIDSFHYTVEGLKTTFMKQYEDAKNLCCKRKYLIHWSCKSLIRANTLGMVLNWEFLDVIYDRTLTVAENLQIFNDSDLEEGIAFSRNTLYRYCKGRGINTREVVDERKAEEYELFKQLHKEGMSLRKEEDYLEAHGISKISTTKLRKYRQMLKEEESKQSA